MVERRLQLKQTTAGITLKKELQRLIKDQKEEAGKLRAQAKSQDNEQLVQELNRRQAEVDKKIAETADELENLKIPLATQMLSFLKT